MKHWNTLTSVETQIIRLGEFKNLFELVLNGVEGGSTIEQLHSGLYTMSGMLEEVEKNLSNEFQNLWDEIRDADNDNVGCGGDCNNCSCETTDTSFTFSTEDNMAAGDYTINLSTHGLDTITLTGLDPDYGDHGGGSTLEDYPELKSDLESRKRWTHIVNEISNLRK